MVLLRLLFLIGMLVDNKQARREKISERMKILQDLVPGCNKVMFLLPVNFFCSHIHINGNEMKIVIIINQMKGNY